MNRRNFSLLSEVNAILVGTNCCPILHASCVPICCPRCRTSHKNCCFQKMKRFEVKTHSARLSAIHSGIPDKIAFWIFRKGMLRFRFQWLWFHLRKEKIKFNWIVHDIENDSQKRVQKCYEQRCATVYCTVTEVFTTMGIIWAVKAIIKPSFQLRMILMCIRWSFFSNSSSLKLWQGWFGYFSLKRVPTTSLIWSEKLWESCRSDVYK